MSRQSWVRQPGWHCCLCLETMREPRRDWQPPLLGTAPRMLGTHRRATPSSLAVASPDQGVRMVLFFALIDKPTGRHLVLCASQAR